MFLETSLVSFILPLIYVRNLICKLPSFVGEGKHRTFFDVYEVSNPH